MDTIPRGPSSQQPSIALEHVPRVLYPNYRAASRKKNKKKFPMKQGEKKGAKRPGANQGQGSDGPIQTGNLILLTVDDWIIPDNH
jgi:hypothetical protein